QVEHIQSDRFFTRIDEMLGHPKFDPHGEPIPDPDGKLPSYKAFPLSDCPAGKKYKLSGVLDHHVSFLTYLNDIGLALGAAIEVIAIREFDQSREVKLNGTSLTIFSKSVCQNLLVS